MTEALRKAIELAQQQPEEQQDVIARLILKEIQAHPTSPEQVIETLEEKKTQRIERLGWSEEEAAKVRESLLSFEEDWSDPGMNVYDEL